MNIYYNMVSCIDLTVFISPIRINHNCSRSALFLAINTGEIPSDCLLD